MINKRIVVISDLDGTLLDHKTYSFAPALPALQRLQRLHIPVVLNSSKTRAEMESIRLRMGNSEPFIVENGAALIIPCNSMANAQEQIKYFSSPISDVLQQLKTLREQGFLFRSFSDMSVDELAEVTGLSYEQATLSKQRLATEPLLWQGANDSLQQFSAQLQLAGLQLVKGGRFLHVMGRFDKADAMHYLLQQYRKLYAGEEVVSIALGDSPNDLKMLEAADYAVVIRGVNSAQLSFSQGKMVIFSQGMGPVGWNGAMQPLLDQLTGREY